MTLQELGAAYEAAVAPSNDAAHAINCLIEDNAPWSRERKAWKTLADGKRSAIDVLRPLPWPADLQPDVDRLLRSLAGEYSWAVEVGRAKTEAQALGAIANFTRENNRGGSSASAVRIALGLDAIPRISRCD